MKAGYTVTVIDAFADRQTVALADKSIVASYGMYGFEPEALLLEIKKLDLDAFEGCLFGSGFESKPALLEEIATLIPLIGNSGEVVARVKSADQFFSELARLGIKCPKVFDRIPDVDRAGRYLKKFAGGSGGTHITFADEGLAGEGEAGLLAGEYYQQQIAGKSVSLLFVAYGDEIDVVGFNEQWLSPCDVLPFRYGGAVSHAELKPEVRLQMLDAAKRLTRAFGLRGLNSLDAIVQDTIVYVLELNPRLSATVDLYAQVNGNLIVRHVNACLSRQDSTGLERGCDAPESKAHAIVYAKSDMEIAPSFEWPAEWTGWITDTYDVCGNAVRISSGAPMCTVIAFGDSAERAKRLVQERVALIYDYIE